MYTALIFDYAKLSLRLFIKHILYIFIYYLLIYSIITNQNDENKYLNCEHVETFFEVLHKQMLILGGLKLGLCTLHRINLPGITIMENRVSLYIFIYLFFSFYIKIILFSWDIFATHLIYIYSLI